MNRGTGRFATALGLCGVFACGAIEGLGPPPELAADAGDDAQGASPDATTSDADAGPDSATLAEGDIGPTCDGANGSCCPPGQPCDAIDAAPEGESDCGPVQIPDSGVLAHVGTVSVIFLPLPTEDITAGLVPTSLSPGANFFKGSSSPSDAWTASSPFAYSAALDGSIYDAIQEGSATYDYVTARGSFDVLWGTVDDSNRLRLLDSSGGIVGELIGTDLSSAAATALGASYSYQNGVNIIVIPSRPFVTAILTAGDDWATFEYSNLVTAGCGP